MKHSTTTIAAAVFAVLVASATSHANPALIKSNIVIVKPHYHAKTSQTFAKWSTAFGDVARSVQRKDPRLAEVFIVLARRYDTLARSPGHGSGWLWIPPGGQAYVVTNKHVAGQAGSVSIEWANNRHPPIGNLPVIYVDDRNDIAVVELPRDLLPREAIGFKLVETSLTESNPVYAAGFPGTDTVYGNIPAYSLTNGIISNAEYPGPEGPAIAHTATIDPGNSGGPLLIEEPMGKLGFRIAGMNTWKATTRSNVNIALPVPQIRQALARALEARQIGVSPTRLASSLRDRADELARELGSSRPNIRLVHSMIAYSFVDEHPEILDMLVKEMVSGKMNKEQINSFLGSPVEYSRATLWAVFFNQFSTGGSDIGAVRLERVTDEVRANAKVRTVFLVGQKRREITWVWEHGAWRITDASFISQRATTTTPSYTPPQQQTALPRRDAPPPAPSVAKDPGGLSVGFHIGFGSGSASGDFASEFESIGSTSLSIDVTKPVSKHWSMVFGLGYNPLGTSYEITVDGDFFEIEEELGYLQIPALAQLNLPVTSQAATLGLIVRGGLGLDLAVERGGQFFGSGSGSLASVGWYDEHNYLNLAAIFGFATEIGFGPAPSLLFGISYTVQRHLFSEWTDEQFTGGANYSYNASHFGLSLRYRGWR